MTSHTAVLAASHADKISDKDLGNAIILVAVIVIVAGAIALWGLQKVAENFSYGWHSGRLHAEREHIAELNRQERS